jgi:hypothetical protein
MKLLVTTAALGLALLRSAGADIDTDHYFVFPRATLVAESGKGKVTSELSRNFAHPTPQQPEPKFSSGHEFQNGIAVNWQFLRKTEHGDVYLVVMKRPGSKSRPVPVLFTGSEQTVFATNDLTVRILPQPPSKK